MSIAMSMYKERTDNKDWCARRRLSSRYHGDDDEQLVGWLLA